MEQELIDEDPESRLYAMIHYVDHTQNTDPTYSTDLQSSDDDEVIEVALPPKPTITIDSSDEEITVLTPTPTKVDKETNIGRKKGSRNGGDINREVTASPVPSVVSSVSDDFIRGDCIAFNISSKKTNQPSASMTNLAVLKNTTDGMFATPRNRRKNKNQNTLPSGSVSNLSADGNLQAKNKKQTKPYSASDSNQSITDTNKQDPKITKNISMPNTSQSVRLVPAEPAVVEQGAPRGRTPRGRATRRGTSRGVTRRGTKRPGPSTLEELPIREMDELPLGRALETPLLQKRMRVSQPSAVTRIVAGPSAQAPPPVNVLSSVILLEEPVYSGGDVAPPSQANVPSRGIHGEVAVDPLKETDSDSKSEQPAPRRPRTRGGVRGGRGMRVRGGKRGGEMSEGQGGKRAKLQPSNQTSASPPPPPSPPVEGPSTSHDPGWMYVDPGPSTSHSPPSPWVSVPPPPPPPCRPGQSLRDEEIDLVNYGSGLSSDESDDEEAIRYPLVPRVLQAAMDTPEDEWFEDADDPVYPGFLDPGLHPGFVGDAAADRVEPAVVPDVNLEVPHMQADRPMGLFDFEWNEFPNTPISPESRRETFSESNVGPTTPSVDPYDIFIEIWDRQIMEHIASETNRYAQQLATQMMDNHTLRPNSRIGRWVDTTADELYVYFALVLAMGVVVKSRLEEYWGATPGVFYTPGFSAHMSINRFRLLSKCLHFSNNDDMCALELDASGAKLFKIQPILTHLNTKFQSMYNLSQNIALDESLLQWKGWLDINQMIRTKAAGIGIKTYELCESQTGYLWRFEVHAHRRSPPQQHEDPLAEPTPAIVLRLLQGLERKGYTVWMDNFYNSPILARRLKSLGFDCVGTLRTDRKFVPQALHGLTKRNMRPGQSVAFTSGDVDVMVWRDKNRVATISTYHGNARQTVQGQCKPIVIFDYNIMMGGVDKKDQLLALYPVERKRTRVWYKKLFRRLLNVSVLNSYIIHRPNSLSRIPVVHPLSHRNFRINLINSLISRHDRRPPRSPHHPRRPIARNVYDITHRIAENAMTGEGRQRQRIRRRCVDCNKRVQTFCVGCDVPVCIDPCFVKLHS